MSITKNNRYYIDDLLEEAGEEGVEQEDQIVFEMPSFCSGDYTATIFLDESGYPYILKAKNYFEQCRDWSVKRQKQKPKPPPTWEEFKETAQNRVVFASDWTPPKPTFESLLEVVDALNQRIPDHLVKEGFVFGLWDSNYAATIDLCGVCLWDSESSNVLVSDPEQEDATYNDIFEHCLRELKSYALAFSGIAKDGWNFDKYK